MAVSSPGSAAGTIASFSFAEVTFKLKMDGSTTEETEAAAESQPASVEKVAWSPGNDACWDTAFNDGAGGWVVGRTVGGIVPFNSFETAQELADSYANRGIRTSMNTDFGTAMYCVD